MTVSVRVAKRRASLALAAILAAMPLAGVADQAYAQSLSKTGKVTSPGANFGSTTQAANGDAISYVIEYTSPPNNPVTLDLTDAVPTSTTFISGTLQAPVAFNKQWSINGGSTWLSTEPASGVTNVRVTTTNPQFYSGGSGAFSSISPPASTSLNTAGASGDGYRAIPVNNNVYVLNHHNGVTYFDCFSELTGARCSNYPVHPSAISGTAFSTVAYSTADANWTGTPGKPLEYVDRANSRIYYQASNNSGHAGVMCVDVVNQVSCGFTALYTASNLGVGASNFPAYNGLQPSPSGRVYLLLASGGAMYCYDTAAAAPCAGSPYSVPVTTDVYSELSLSLGTKMIVSSPNSPAQIFCWDHVAAALCAGWTTQTLPGNNYVQLYPVLSAAGMPTGVCARGLSNFTKSCFNLDGTVYVPPVSFLTWMDNYVGGFYGSPAALGYSFGDAAYYATRTFHNGQPGGTGPWVEGCYDWSVPGDCAGNAGETWPVNNANVAQRHYATIADPTIPGCMWMNGDDGVIGSFWALDGGSCTGRTSVVATVTPSNLTCDGLPRPISYTNITLFGLVAGTDYTSARLTLRDASTNLPISGFNNISATFPVDISAVSYATYPSIVVEVRFAGIASNTPFTQTPPPHVSVNWNGPPPQFCFAVHPTGCTTPSIANSASMITTPPGGASSTQNASANTFTHILDAACSTPGLVTLTKEVCTSPNPASCTLTSTNWAASTNVPTGSTVSWRITVANTSSSDEARGVTLSDAVTPSCVTSAGTFALAPSTSSQFLCASTNVTAPTTNTSTASGTLVVAGTPPGTPGPFVTSNLGSAQATPQALPTAAKSFNPTTIGVGSTSVLSVTITNPNATAVTSVVFTDAYPSGLVNSATPNAASTCGGTVSASTGSASLALTGGTIPASGSCTVSVNVTSATGGSYANSTGSIATDAGSVPAAQATLLVLALPAAQKAFTPATIGVDATSVLTITLVNPNSAAITGVSFNDVYPANVVNATTPNATTSCSGAVSATAGGASLALSGGTIPANGSCVVSVSVTSSVAGSYVNNTGSIASSAGTLPSAQATLTVTPLALPTVQKTFTPTTIPVGGASTVTITLSNSNTSALTNVAYTDTYPANLVNATVPNPSNTCSGTANAVAGGSSHTFSGGTIPANGSCTVTVRVSSSVAGSYINSTGNVTSNAGTSPGAQATLTVTPLTLPTAQKVFTPATIVVGGTSTLTITLTNSNAIAASGIAFTDVYPANVINAATPNASTTCGGTVSATPGGASLALNGGTISANSSCVVSVNVSASAAGSYVNNTGIITSSAGTIPSAQATLTAVVLSPPSAQKAFSATSIVPGAGAVLTITVVNPNTTAVTGVAFTDNYPASLINATPANPSTTCGGTVSATAGGNSLALANGTIPASSSCVVSVNVTSSIPGVYINNLGTVTTADAGSTAPVSATLSVGENAVIPTLSEWALLMLSGMLVIVGGFAVQRRSANARR